MFLVNLFISIKKREVIQMCVRLLVLFCYFVSMSLYNSGRR